MPRNYVKGTYGQRYGIGRTKATIVTRISSSLHARVKMLSKARGVSINSFVVALLEQGCHNVATEIRKEVAEDL